MNTGFCQGLGIGTNEGPQNRISLLHGNSALEYGPKPELWPWEQDNIVSYNQTLYFVIICSILSLGKQHGFCAGDLSTE